MRNFGFLPVYHASGSSARGALSPVSSVGCALTRGLSRHFMRIGITTSLPGLPQSPSIGLKTDCVPVAGALLPNAGGPATQVAACVPAGRRDLRPARRRPLPKARLRRRQKMRAKAHMFHRKTIGQTRASKRAWSGAVRQRTGSIM